MEVLIEKQGAVMTVILNRPEAKNAVDRNTADQLCDAFRKFEADDSARVAVFWGAGGCFCAGADLKAASKPEEDRFNRLEADMSKDGPMGPSRMQLSKPVIAAIAGYAVAGGLELACWCDLRVMEEDAVFGVYCRRYGVPLIDGGTQRLPRLIGMSRAMDMILTGRTVDANTALAWGLANRVVPTGMARREAESLAARIAEFPQFCMRSDREAAYRGCSMEFDAAMKMEFDMGMRVILSGETVDGAKRFTQGLGKVKP